MNDKGSGMNKPLALQSDYDTFVDWNKRLRGEGPFFKKLFEEVGVHRVVDVGAGSARHSIMFATWGCDVVAVDPDDSMLERAHANAREFANDIAQGGGKLEVLRGGFGVLHKMNLGLADAVVCTGNALPHVAGRDGLTEALADFSAIMAPGGVLVLHLLNHQRLLEWRPRSIAPKVVETPEGTLVFVRVIDYPEGGEFIDLDFVTLGRDLDGEWSVAGRRSPHTAIPVDLLRTELPCAGFTDVEVFGGHDGHALSDADESVIVVARRA